MDVMQFLVPQIVELCAAVKAAAEAVSGTASIPSRKEFLAKARQTLARKADAATAASLWDSLTSQVWSAVEDNPSLATLLAPWAKDLSAYLNDYADALAETAADKARSKARPKGNVAEIVAKAQSEATQARGLFAALLAATNGVVPKELKPLVKEGANGFLLDLPKISDPSDSKPKGRAATSSTVQFIVDEQELPIGTSLRKVAAMYAIADNGRRVTYAELLKAWKGSKRPFTVTLSNGVALTVRDLPKPKPETAEAETDSASE